MYGSIAKREKKIQIYTASCSSSGNTELIEHELLKINFSKSHQYCYRQTPTSVKKLLAFQSPIFHDLSPSGWESLCLQWCLPCCSKAASCLNVCKWNYVLKLTLPFLGGAALWLWMASDLSWHSRQKTLQICLQLYPLTFNQRIHRPTKTLLLPETWVSLHLCSADRATMWETHLA